MFSTARTLGVCGGSWGVGGRSWGVGGGSWEVGVPAAAAVGVGVLLHRGG